MQMFCDNATPVLKRLQHQIDAPNVLVNIVAMTLAAAMSALTNANGMASHTPRVAANELPRVGNRKRLQTRRGLRHS
jgi:hypothetical protein